ncbi:hypothetical protein Tco_0331430 [Tanacetum coccineum]
MDEECIHEAKIDRKEIIEEKVDAKGVYAYMQKGVSTEDQVSTVKPDEGTDKLKVSTGKPKVSTAKPKEVEVSTDKLDEGTAKPKDGTSDESTALTTIFRDDEIIAEKRPRPQPDDDSDDEHRKFLRIVTFDSTIDSEIMETKCFVSKLHKVSSSDGDYLVVYRVNGHFRAFNYLMEEIVSWRLYEACRVFIIELKDGIVIYMLVERRYSLSKELLQRMLDLGLEVKEESTAALHFLASPGSNSSCAPCYGNEALTSPKVNSFGKDKSNPLIVDSLLKTIRLSIHLVFYNEELAIPKQMATGKGISNPLMAGSLPKTTKPT